MPVALARHSGAGRNLEYISTSGLNDTQQPGRVG